jgi:hypothetical protein
MNAGTAAKYAYSTQPVDRHGEVATSEQLPTVTTMQLSRRASFGVALLLSLVLWAAVWAGFAALASAILG